MGNWVVSGGFANALDHRLSFGPLALNRFLPRLKSNDNIMTCTVLCAEGRS